MQLATWPSIDGTQDGHEVVCLWSAAWVDRRPTGGWLGSISAVASMTPATPQESDHPAGLSQAEASVRLARDGPNALPSPSRKSLLAVVLAVAAQPMVLLLLACTLLYALLGN